MVSNKDVYAIRGVGKEKDMQVVRYSANMAPIAVRSAVALGLFDGVHLAHRALLDRTRSIARERGLSVAVFTFSSEDQSLKGHTTRIYGTEQKLALLEEAGVETVLIADFSALRDVDAETFVKDVLVGVLGAEAAVAGYNFRFGRGAVADSDVLARLMAASGGVCEIVSPYRIGDAPLSSTYIKSLLSEGRIEEANRCLASPYRITGVVEHGRGLGRTWGVPTVNLSLPTDPTPLRYGVYRSAALVGGRPYHAVTNVGTCPSFPGREAHTETYIFGCNDDLYGENITVYLLGFLRDERVFEDVESLKMQIEVDKNRAITENGDAIWQAIGQN